MPPKQVKGYTPTASASRVIYSNNYNSSENTACDDVSPLYPFFASLVNTSSSASGGDEGGEEEADRRLSLLLITYSQFECHFS